MEERLRAEMSVEGQVQVCCRYNEDHIVILDCPQQIIKCPNIRCGASLEVPEYFDSCFALKCNSCRRQFCGWCLVHVGNDAHSHVRRCDKSGNPGNPKSFLILYKFISELQARTFSDLLQCFKRVV